MATLLQAVNKVLRRTQIITSDLSSLTASGKQPWVDTCVYAWNEVLLDLYSTSDLPFPQEVATSTFTLATSDRDYSLAADLIQLRYPIKDETNGRYITEYPGGFMQMQEDQVFISNETGLPYLAAFSPIDGTLYLDKIPTSNENGLVYRYWYDKDLELSDAADTFPFNDHVYLSLVPAVAELWRLENQQAFNSAKYTHYMGMASKFLTQTQQRTSWLPVKIPLKYSDMNDPYGGSNG